MLDFSNFLKGDGFTACSLAGHERLVSVIPDRLQVFIKDDGAPAFRLEAVRGITPFSKPKPYGVFEIQLTPAEMSEDTVSQIKDVWPLADLKTVTFNTGYLGLSLIGDDGESLSDELESPVQLSQLPLSKMRFIRRTSIEFLKLLKDALHKELLLLKGYGFFSVTGYAPRIPIEVSFNPSELIHDFITESGITNDKVTYSDFEEYFRKSIEDLPLDVRPESDHDVDLFGTAMTDWYLQRFCSALPPSATDQDVYYSTHEDAKSNGSFTWNINERLAVERHTFFTLDAIDEARRIVKERGIEEVYTARVVEPIKTGFLRVEVFHPFFQIPVGVRQIGIKIEVPANAPLRPQSIQKTVIFDAGQSLKSVTLQFSPDEDQIYEVLPYAIYGDSSGTREILGDPFETSDQELVIESKRYPLFLASFISSVNLRSQASLMLTIRKKGEEDSFLGPVLLSSETPSAMVALPVDESLEFECSITARSLTMDEEVSSIIPVLEDYKIDLTTFREYGSHEVLLKMNTPEGKVIGVDLIAASAEPDSSKITTIAFSDSNREASWSWFSPSVFQAGFRYRFHGTPGGEWSDIQSPFTKELTLEPEHATI